MCLGVTVAVADSLHRMDVGQSWRMVHNKILSPLAFKALAALGLAQELILDPLGLPLDNDIDGIRRSYKYSSNNYYSSRLRNRTKRRRNNESRCRKTRRGSRATDPSSHPPHLDQWCYRPRVPPLSHVYHHPAPRLYR